MADRDHDATDLAVHRAPDVPAPRSANATDGLPTAADGDVAALEGLAEADNTRRAYAADWRQFVRWCDLTSVRPLPADTDTVKRFVVQAADLVDDTGQAAYRVSTLRRWVSAINAVHVRAGQPPPVQAGQLDRLFRALRRTRKEQPNRRPALLLKPLRDVLDHIDQSAHRWPDGVAARRDACLLLVGFVGAFRSAELRGLEAADVQVHDADGLHVLLRESKGDRDAQGVVKALPKGRDARTCAPCRWVHWQQLLAHSDAGTDRSGMMGKVFAGDLTAHVCTDPPELPLPPQGAAFRRVSRWGQVGPDRTGKNTADQIVRRRAVQAGLVDGEQFGSHSLRAGFVTQAFRDGADPVAIARQTGHADLNTLRVYQRDAPLVGNAVTDLDL